MLLCSLDLSTGCLCRGSVHTGWSLSLPWEQDRTIRFLTGHPCLRVAPEGCSINERRHLRCLSQRGHTWGLGACPVPREMGVELMSTDQCLWDLSSCLTSLTTGTLKILSLNCPKQCVDIVSWQSTKGARQRTASFSSCVPSSC